MMRFQIVVLVLLLSLGAFAQVPDSDDKSRVMDRVYKCAMYSTVNFDSARYFGDQALTLAEKTDFLRGKINALAYLGITYTRSGNVPKALQLEFAGLQLARENNLRNEEALCLYTISKSYYFLNDYPTSISYAKKARQLFLKLEKSLSSSRYNSDDKISIVGQFIDNELILGEAFMDNNQLDSAIVYMTGLESKIAGQRFGNIVNIFLGDAYFRSGNRSLGMTYLRSALQTRILEQDYYSMSWNYNIMARCFIEMNQPDTAIYYARLGMASAQKVGFKARVLDASRLLATLYANRDLKEANYYLNLSARLNEELFGSKKFFELQKTLAEEQLQRQEVEKKQLLYESNIRQYVLISGIGVIVIIAVILYRNNRQRKKANYVLESALNNLRSTQSQLIQSEKMASLGELTAGIAHEIQNPLNFVNNFSEVSNELIQELKVEKLKASSERDEKLEEELLTDISQNLEKINHHGKRADAIVKGMLQHSRSSSGQKELTDLNALCDEYLRLSYHGLRAKDKSFNAKFETDLDISLPKVNVVPQDIGRVVLNLINNAFYAVNEKQKRNTSGYEPIVSIGTKQVNGKVEIKVKDNGNGIPEAIKEKIFQPFFTTKPTGQGTGLGLSLSYDIVKAHGGELKVETKEGEGSAFFILLTV